MNRIVFTTLAGVGQGLVLALFVSDALGAATPLFLRDGALVALILLAAGLAPSPSRELIVLPLLMALVAAYAVLHTLQVESTLVLGAAAVLACLALFVRMWRSPLAIVSFMLLGSASGLSAAAALAAWLEPGLARPYVGAALLVGFFAYLARLASLVRNARLRPKPSLQRERAVRWSFLLLLYPVPAVLLVEGWEAAAFGAQYLGLLAERWYFFAEATE